MTARQREHPEAAAELDAAVHWYEQERTGLGALLLDRAEQARHDIAEWPDASPPARTLGDGTIVRSKAIHGFPYRIVYAVEPAGVVILAYAHERREPAFWALRRDA